MTQCKIYRVHQITFFFLENALKKTAEYFLKFFLFKAQSFRLMMEINFIQIAASAGHVVAYTIEEKWRNYASGPKSTPNSDSFWVRRFFNVSVRVFCVPNEIILPVYIPANIKMSFIWKGDFFLTKSASSVSRSQTHFSALFKRIHNHIRSVEGWN